MGCKRWLRGDGAHHKNKHRRQQLLAGLRTRVFCHLNGHVHHVSRTVPYPHAELQIAPASFLVYFIAVAAEMEHICHELLHILHARKKEHQCVHNIRAAPPPSASFHIPLERLPQPEERGGTTEGFQVPQSLCCHSLLLPPAQPKCKLRKTLPLETTAGSRWLVPVVPFSVPVNRGTYMRRATVSWRWTGSFKTVLRAKMGNRM